jgi:hypothetical protein
VRLGTPDWRFPGCPSIDAVPTVGSTHHGSQEVVMAGSRADVSELVADVDQRLQLTYDTLIVARRRFRRCPSASQGRACQIVEAQLDELLDLRLALTCPRGSSVGSTR